MTKLKYMTIETRIVELLKTLRQQYDEDMPVPTDAENNATSDLFSEMSMRELHAFCLGCLTNRQYSATFFFIVQLSKILIRISEDTDEETLFRETAGRLAGDYLTQLAVHLWLTHDRGEVSF